MARNLISRACNGYAQIHKYIKYIINRRKEERDRQRGEEDRELREREKKRTAR